MSARLTEAELDAANAASFDRFTSLDDLDTMPPPLDYAGCSGHCHQGRRACDCSRAHTGLDDGMFDEERRHPWRWYAAYAAAFVAAIVASSFWPWGFA